MPAVLTFAQSIVPCQWLTSMPSQYDVVGGNVGVGVGAPSLVAGRGGGPWASAGLRRRGRVGVGDEVEAVLSDVQTTNRPVAAYTVLTPYSELTEVPLTVLTAYQVFPERPCRRRWCSSCRP